MEPVLPQVVEHPQLLPSLLLPWSPWASPQTAWSFSLRFLRVDYRPPVFLLGFTQGEVKEDSLRRSERNNLREIGEMYF